MIIAIFAGEFGVPKPWYFPLTSSYWYSKGYAIDNVALDQHNIELDANNEGDYLLLNTPSFCDVYFKLYLYMSVYLGISLV